MLQSLDVPQLVTLVVRVLLVAAPAVVVLAGLFIVRPLVMGGVAGRKRIRLSFRGLAHGGGELRTVGRLVILPVVGLTALTVSFGIEQEVREGPSRVIEGMTNRKPTSWVLQSGTDHLMNVSVIPEPIATATIEAVRRAGFEAAPFYASLASIDTGERVVTGHVFAAPPQARMNPVPVEGHGCQSPDGSPCVFASDDHALVDSANGIDVGDRLRIRGESFEVVGYSSTPRSLINRLVVYVSVGGFARVEGSLEPYGLLVAGEQGQVLDVVDDNSLQVLSSAEVREANEDFWAGNGTPLLLLLIGLISLFAATSTYLGQRAEHEQNRVVLGTLWAIGLTRNQMIEVQLVRSLMAVLCAAPIAWLASGVLLRAANQSILGFSADRTLRHLLAASALLVIGAVAAAMSLAHQNRKARPFQMIG